MRSDRHKVLHPIAGRPMLGWVVRAAFDAGAARVLCVTRPGDGVDPRVGLAQVLGLGQKVARGQPLAVVHAAGDAAAQGAAQAITGAMQLADSPAGVGPAVLEFIEA